MFVFSFFFLKMVIFHIVMLVYQRVHTCFTHLSRLCLQGDSCPCGHKPPTDLASEAEQKHHWRVWCLGQNMAKPLLCTSQWIRFSEHLQANLAFLQSFPRLLETQQYYTHFMTRFQSLSTSIPESCSSSEPVWYKKTTGNMQHILTVWVSLWRVPKSDTQL